MAHVLVLRTAGTNCDEETVYAFELTGADVERLHVGVLLRGERRLDEFDVFVLPGGFAYGDDLGAGAVLANQLRTRLADDLRSFVASGKLVLGICNGFQVLVRLGILPGWEGEKAASLIENVSGKFEDRWVQLRVASTLSPFLDFAPDDGSNPHPHGLRLPIAHKEGRFVLRDAALVERLRENGQIAFTYCRTDTGESAAADACGEYPANPNGSVADVAGLLNPAGNVLGLMPHPERFVHRLQDPLWTRQRRSDSRDAGGGDDLTRSGDGFALFESAVRYVDRCVEGSA